MQAAFAFSNDGNLPLPLVRRSEGTTPPRLRLPCLYTNPKKTRGGFFPKVYCPGSRHAKPIRSECTLMAASRVRASKQSLALPLLVCSLCSQRHLGKRQDATPTLFACSHSLSSHSYSVLSCLCCCTLVSRQPKANAKRSQGNRTERRRNLL